MSRAIFALSGDPITNGHIDIIKRASKVFKTLVVGIGHNSQKKYMFDIYQRMDMVEAALAAFDNVEVVKFKGLLVDYAYLNGISTIVRGVRNSADFEMEKRLSLCGQSQELGIDTFLLMTDKNLEHVSSGTVKTMIENGGFINDYVPYVVKEKLEKVISDKTIIGITGEICSGKSYVADELVKGLKYHGKMAYNVDLDVLGHEILDTKLKTKVFKDVRKQIASYFGYGVVLRGGKINRKALGEIVFSDPTKLKYLSDLMKTPIRILFRQRLSQMKGIVLVNSALLAEADWLPMCNNNVILVGCEKTDQYKRLQGRYDDPKHIEGRLKSQSTYDDKLDIINREIKKHNYGRIYNVLNTAEHSKDNIDTLAKILKIG